MILGMGGCAEKPSQWRQMIREDDAILLAIFFFIFFRNPSIPYKRTSSNDGHETFKLFLHSIFIIVVISAYQIGHVKSQFSRRGGIAIDINAAR